MSSFVNGDNDCWRSFKHGDISSLNSSKGANSGPRFVSSVEGLNSISGVVFEKLTTCTLSKTFVSLLLSTIVGRAADGTNAVPRTVGLDSSFGVVLERSRTCEIHERTRRRVRACWAPLCAPVL